MSVPISNANTILLDENPGTLPTVNNCIFDMFQPMSFEVVTKTIVNFQVVETQVTTAFYGVWQPFSPRQLMLLQEGERAWGWYMVHADPSLSLNPDDVITYQGTQYRVMGKNDYTNYGYLEYNVVQDFTGSGPT